MQIDEVNALTRNSVPMIRIEIKLAATGPVTLAQRSSIFDSLPEDDPVRNAILKAADAAMDTISEVLEKQFPGEITGPTEDWRDPDVKVSEPDFFSKPVTISKD